MEPEDLDYRPLYSFPKMVRDLLCELVPEPWVEDLDFSTLQLVDSPVVPPDFSSDFLDQERGRFWKVDVREGAPLYLYLVVGHQSEMDRFVAVQMMASIGLFYETLLGEEGLSAEGDLPLVIPILLLTGDTAWEEPQELAELFEPIAEGMEEHIPHLRYLVIAPGCLAPEDLEKRQSITAQLFWLKQAGKPEALRQGVGRLIPLVADPKDGALRAAVIQWFGNMLALGREAPEDLGPEELEALLEGRRR